MKSELNLSLRSITVEIQLQSGRSFIGCQIFKWWGEDSGTWNKHLVFSSCVFGCGLPVFFRTPDLQSNWTRNTYYTSLHPERASSNLPRIPPLLPQLLSMLKTRSLHSNKNSCKNKFSAKNVLYVSNKFTQIITPPLKLGFFCVS